MPYTERNLSSDFTNWLKNKRHPSLPLIFVYELKITKTDSLPYAHVEPHQIASLYKSKHSCFTYKISDLSPGDKPFDGFSFCNIPAYLIINFYKPKQPNQKITIIDIDALIAHEKQSARRSLTSLEASNIGTCYELA